jgi:cobalt-zinc-cadmium efflux system protein
MCGQGWYPRPGRCVCGHLRAGNDHGLTAAGYGRLRVRSGGTRLRNDEDDQEVLARLLSMSRPARLTIVLVLNLLLVAGLVTVGLSANSIGVLAEGADYLADAAGIGVSLLAIWLSERPPTVGRPHGHPTAAALAALVNSGWLLILSLLVITGAIDRLATGSHQVHGLPVLIVSGIAAVVMLGGALILAGDAGNLDNDDSGDLNMRAILLDTAADAAAAAGVAIAGAVILVVGGLYWLDPAVALVISAVVACQAIRLLRQVGGALRQARQPAS